MSSHVAHGDLAAAGAMHADQSFHFLCFVSNVHIHTQLRSDDNFLVAELGFNAFFTVELLLRAGASGGPRAYLSNAWNIFDLLMVLAGYTEFLPASWFGELPAGYTVSWTLLELAHIIS